MNAREQIELKYHVVNGIIMSPGKFEGERYYVPYLWEVVLDGFSESVYNEDELIYDKVEIEQSDIDLFPELAGYSYAQLEESEQGFIFCRLVQ